MRRDGRVSHRSSFENAPALAASAALAFRQVSAGDNHTCGLTTDDRADRWGRNEHGQLGDGSKLSRSRPTPVARGLFFTRIRRGYRHTCGVTLDGQAYCRGLDDNGQLGINSLTDRVRPVLVQGGRRWAFVEAGGFHTCGITTDDKAFCWGDNSRGALGNNGGVRPSGAGAGGRHAPLSPGERGSTFQLCGQPRRQGVLLGENLWGQLGNGDRDDEDAPHSEYQTPTAVAGGLSFRQISAGSFHTCGRTLGGQAYCWGFNLRGSLGDGSLDLHLTPQAVSGGLSYKQLVVGTSGTCGVTTAGRAYCWGYNFAGALGNGTTGDRMVPTAVAGGFLFSNVSMGGNHTCGVMNRGPALCWGLNTSGQLGLGTATGPELCPPIDRASRAAASRRGWSLRAETARSAGRASFTTLAGAKFCTLPSSRPGRRFVPPSTRSGLMAAPQAEPATAVLVVDDEPLALRFTERVLADAGYRVQSAADGIRALELVGQWSIPPDLLITDLRMPGLNGCELARRISAIHPSVRVLLVSAADPEHLERVGRSCGSLSHPRHCLERSSSSSGQALVGEQAKA